MGTGKNIFTTAIIGPRVLVALRATALLFWVRALYKCPLAKLGRAFKTQNHKRKSTEKFGF